jgi:hypothetical protein
MLSTALAKLPTAKAAVTVIAVSGGGVALAAGSGHQPGISSPNHRPTARPDTTIAASHPAAHAPSATSATSTATPSHKPDTRSARPHRICAASAPPSKPAPATTPARPSTTPPSPC